MNPPQSDTQLHRKFDPKDPGLQDVSLNNGSRMRCFIGLRSTRLVLRITHVMLELHPVHEVSIWSFRLIRSKQILLLLRTGFPLCGEKLPHFSPPAFLYVAKLVPRESNDCACQYHEASAPCQEFHMHIVMLCITCAMHCSLHARCAI